MKLVSLSFCGPAAATLRRRLAWSASSLHGRPQPAPPRGQAPALPRPGCLFVLGPQGPWTAQRPQTSHTQGSGRFLFLCCRPLGAKRPRSPPALPGGRMSARMLRPVKRQGSTPSGSPPCLLSGLARAVQRRSVGCRSCGGRHRRCPAPSALASQRQRLGGCTTVPALPGACGLVAFILIPPQLPPSGSPRPPRGAGAFRFSGVLRYAGGGILALFSWASGPRHRQARYTVQPQKPLLTTIGC